MYLPFLPRQQPRNAAKLQQGLKGFTPSYRDPFNSIETRLLDTLMYHVVTRLKPDGPGVCDHNALERTVNIITSLPYAFVGLHALKHRKSTEGKLWGASLVGVTGGAVAFHASYGKARNLCRKIDYWCIAISSTMLFRAVFPEAPAYYSLMSLMSTPFQPFHVSTANVAAMEIEFMRRAGKDSSLKRTHHKHLAASVVGTSCFFIEDISPTLPMVHAAWHGMSTYATATCNHLIAAVENDRFAQ